jgi:hypothetical protein
MADARPSPGMKSPASTPHLFSRSCNMFSEETDWRGQTLCTKVEEARSRRQPPAPRDSAAAAGGGVHPGEDGRQPGGVAGVEAAAQARIESRGRRRGAEVAAVSPVERCTPPLNDKGAGSLRPALALFPTGNTRLRANPPAQSLETNQNTAQQHERHTTVGNTYESLPCEVPGTIRQKGHVYSIGGNSKVESSSKLGVSNVAVDDGLIASQHATSAYGEI